MKVNETRRSILEIIRNNDSWISGESLSQKINISRVAVWKHIKALQVDGYNIESGHRGYKFQEEGDNLSSMDFDIDEGIHFYKELESTMSAVTERMKDAEGESEDFIILTDHQLAGVGRDGEDWISPSGGIYLTYVINRSLPLTEAALIPLRGILTVLQSLKSSGISNSHFGWPGNIMIHDQKVGGVLEEYHVRGGHICWYALGIGLHINDTISGHSLASIADITGINLNRRKFVRLLKETWEKNLCLNPVELCRDINPYARFMNKHVSIQNRLNETLEGIAHSIDTEGRLCLVSDSYTTRVLPGESIKLTISGWS